MKNLVEIESTQRVARITLNRPEKRNALSGEMVEALQRALDEVEHNDGIRVVILTGAGSAFSAGADLESLSKMQSASATDNAEDSHRLAALFRRIYTYPKPVIARINGHAIAGGCGLAAVCDFSIAVETARLGFTEVRIGFVPAIVMLFVLRKVGEAGSRRLMLTGDLISAAQAVELKMQSASATDNAEDSHRLAALFRRIYTYPKPVIARINGHAIAGGCGLAAVCDFSIAVETARLGFTEVRIGFVPAIVMLFVLRKVGEAGSRRLMLTGDLISAAQAVELNLIDETVPESELNSRVDELADSLATNTSASALRMTKQMLARIPGMGFDEALEYAAGMNAFARSTSDCKAGIAAFLSKTDPPWKQ